MGQTEDGFRRELQASKGSGIPKIGWLYYFKKRKNPRIRDKSI